MERPEAADPEEMLRSQTAIWDCIFGFVDGMALKCVVELGIPDMINSHGCPLSLSSIVKSINHASLDADRLSRVLKLLVHRGIFTSNNPASQKGAQRYYYSLWPHQLLQISTPGIKHNGGGSEDHLKDGFNGVGSLVDVGGGTGAMVSEIVKAHPHVKGINFDLPHVVATAPEYEGVTHVAGNMFTSIPPADAILLKVMEP
ncbi:hypothetical protein GH714_036830 [Hevea brasiliensis]|uniref:O-methyltransferase domain-containing protein n=1 Tax=Hevea brasiliensis TaxID=3981 RepID=A0A6A6NF35_HEVBR|nr:hypothetical protein GH714_036830 [Hevea brasiliensis]